ncbi:hypothetical protein HY992_03945 [Candidatus Micrarchaeota archaeon]|nr:hypothetical protein [Candidatus Micrarchaeota archaeon]
MKIRLTNELAYFIGLWKSRPSPKGLGISCSGEASEIFIHETLALKLIEPSKILVEGNSVHFFHTAYKNFFEKVVREQLEIFHSKNKKAASYLAGFFDGCGGISEQGGVFIAKATPSDEMLLERLGFRTIHLHGKVFVLKPREFTEFIKPFMKHSIKNYLP